MAENLEQQAAEQQSGGQQVQQPVNEQQQRPTQPVNQQQVATQPTNQQAAQTRQSPDEQPSLTRRTWWDWLQLLLPPLIVLMVVVTSFWFGSSVQQQSDQQSDQQLSQAQQLHTTLITSSRIPDLEIITSFPPQMEIEHSYVIGIGLFSNKGGQISYLQADSDLLKMEKATTIVTSSTPIAIGTPGATLKNTFGEGYEPVATATLYAGTFAIQPGDSQEQPLEQPLIVWKWNVTPQKPGTQIISEEIRVVWKSIKKDNITTLSLVIANPQISVDVNPQFDWNPVIAPALATILGTGLLALIPWIWRQVSKRGKNKTEKRSSKIPYTRRSNNHVAKSGGGGSRRSQ
jgi:hypothetical protein